MSETDTTYEFGGVRLRSSRFPNELNNLIRRIKRTYKHHKDDHNIDTKLYFLFELLEITVKGCLRRKLIDEYDAEMIKQYFRINF